MKKIVTSLAVASILGVSAVADTDGVFVGIQGSTGFDYSKQVVDTPANSTEGTTATSVTASVPSWQLGVLGGYKMFFTPKVGLRLYGLINYKSGGLGDSAGTSYTNSTLAFNANADVLFDFVTSKELDFGVFGGLSLGYASNELETESDDGTGVITITRYEYGSGLDFGLNLGLRALLAQKHGLEVYSRIGFLERKESTTTATYKSSTPFTLGLRYTYSF